MIDQHAGLVSQSLGLIAFGQNCMPTLFLDILHTQHTHTHTQLTYSKDLYIHGSLMLLGYLFCLVVS